MKTTIVTAIFALLTIAAFGLVWLNRASEKILTAVIPVAAAGLIAIYLAVFVFGGEPSVSTIFPIAFQYQIASKMPANLPLTLFSRRDTMSLFLPAQLHSTHPEYFSDPADSDGILLHRHLVQRVILDWLAFHYSNSWDIEMTQFDLPGSRSQQFAPASGTSVKTKIYGVAEIDQKLTGNRFQSVHSAMARQLSVPPKTELLIEVPRDSGPAGHVGRITLENPFCTLSILFQDSTWMRGLGAYKELAGLSDDENNMLATATFNVRISVEFNRLMSGNPQMPSYKRWAAGIVEGLKDQFDEQLIWSRTKGDYLFAQQVKQLGPMKDNLAPYHQSTITKEGVKDQVMIPDSGRAQAAPALNSHTKK